LGIVSDLFISFHQRLAPLLFGYRLELGKFPYLPDGPEAITPLILGVICLFSSERLPQFMSLHAPIAEVVHELLLKNPAESWQSLDMAKSNSEQPASLDVDRLDPELGDGCFPLHERSGAGGEDCRIGFPLGERVDQGKSSELCSNARM
jgi:hypothetical protein